MIRRLNPWPAFVDLFACLLIGTFAGFVLLSVANEEKQKENQELRERVEEVSELRGRIEDISHRVEEALKGNSTLGSVVRKCGEDTCIDVYAHFDLNGVLITDQTEAETIRTAAELLRDSLLSIPDGSRSLVEVVIEGHSDDTQMSTSADPRSRYLYNWELSARRAASVLYEFAQRGIAPPYFNIVAIGLADSDPLCTESTDDCRWRNRRTTLRLRVNSERIAAGLKS